MTYFDDYKTRMNAYGNGFINSHENVSTDLINERFKDSSSYTLAVINNQNIGIRLLNTDETDKKQVLFEPGSDYNIGELIDVGADKYLIIEFCESDVFPKADVQLCNNTLTIQTETQGTLQGYDSMGRPVYGQPTITNHNFPCIVKKISEMYNKSDGNDAVNIVQGSIVLQIQNTDDPSLFIGQKFKMFNTEYQITSFDLSETINNTEGLLLVIADKIT